MRRATFFLFLLVILAGNRLSAQKEGAIWYFGYHAGLDFNGFYPTPKTDGALSTREGVASIADKNGKLLFYTDGQTVYNREHQVMEEGLMGNSTSTQSSIVVPLPRSSSVYYLFTVDRVGSTSDPGNGLKYSIVNMSLNFGLGKVIPKNQSLMPAGDNTLFTEKITAVKSKDTTFYWIIAHEFNTNAFLLYKLTKDGITGTGPFRRIPVGMIHKNEDSDEQTNWGATGYLKSSPKGDLLAVAVESQKSFELFKFDNENGNIVSIGVLPAGSPEKKFEAIWNAYGVEFSPTSNYLYGSARKGGVIYRWNISNLTNPEGIKQSVEFLREDKSSLCGALQLAFNGKIYASIHGKPYLGVVNAPIQENCDYSENPGASLYDNDKQKGGTAGFGLPTFLPDFFKAAEFYYQKTCFNDTTFFYLSTKNIAQPPKWTIFDIDSIKIGPATVDSKTFDGYYRFPAAGEYIVVLEVKQIGMGDIMQSQHVTIHQQPDTKLDDTTNLCQGGFVTLDAGYGAFYKWENPNLLLIRYRDIYVPGPYKVTVTHYNGCSKTDSTLVVEQPLPVVDTIQVHKATCGMANGTILILMKSDNSLYEFSWGDPIPSENHTNQAHALIGGVYEVTITTKKTGCVLVRNIAVSEEGAPVVTIASSVTTAVCPGTPVTLTAAGPKNFIWQSPAEIADTHDAVLVVNPLKTTTYFVKGYNVDINGQECADYASYTIEVFTVIPPDLGKDLWEACEGEPVSLDGGDYVSWNWSNGMTTREIHLTESCDQLVLNVIDRNGCLSSDMTKITIKPLPVVDLHEDRIVCQGTEVILDGGDADSWSWIPTGDTTRYFSVTSTGPYKVTATKQGCIAEDEVFIQVNIPDSIKIGFAISNVTCNGAADGSIQITATGEGSSYEFSIDDGLNYYDNGGLFENLDGSVPYRIRVREDGVCTRSVDDLASISEPDPVTIDYQLVSPSCNPCEDGEITLTVSGGAPPYSVLWSTMDSTLRLRHIGLGTYPVWVKDAHGCGKYQTIVLGMGHTTYSIPNAFTPNGDGNNEEWTLTALANKPDCIVQVFDRRGRLVFESEPAYPKAWDGTDRNGDPVAVGSYFYLIYPDGLSEKKTRLTGAVTVLR